MLVDGVDGKPDDFHVAPVELRLELGHIAELGGTHRGEILRVREQHCPRVADPVMKADAALGSGSFEVGGSITDLQCHSRSPFSFSVMCRWL
jgi:hypothetical protein